MPSDIWSWNKLVSTKIWHQLCFDGWPGWDLDPDTKEPYLITIHTKKGEDPSSYLMANKIDDMIDRQFYYRDYTDSGIQIVYDGEIYKSYFWFQSTDDYLYIRDNIMSINNSIRIDQKPEVRHK